MKKTLVLAEKPSVGRDIANVLKCKNEKNGYIEGEKYVVTWALGHLVTLADPEGYNSKYKEWKMEDLPIIPKYLKTVVIKKSGKQYQKVKSLLERNDIEDIVIATDAGREGELVARWIIEKSGVNKPMKRLWISSNTDKAIKEGFNKLESSKKYDNLYNSALARAEADWIIGINATRALTVKYNAQLSCGRVQTPTLNMVMKREDEIKSFEPKKFYGIEIVVNKAGNSIKLNWKNNKGNTYLFNEESIDKIINKIKNNDAQVIKYSVKSKKTYSPQLYNLTELQRDANKIYGYSAKETLSTMQNLYERHKLLTYPRTDSRYISTDIVDTLKDRVKAVCIGDYRKVCNDILKRNIKISKSFVDNSKVIEHYAIIPTEERVFLNELTVKERNIYELVIKRFLSVLYDPEEYDETIMECEISGEKFNAKFKNIKKLGWKELYSNEENAYLSTVIFKEGEKLNVDKISKIEGKTNPPSHLNEATLLTMMEKNNLGTVATRADIIDKLFSTFLLEKKNNDILITQKGRQLLDLVPEKLKSAEMTSEWEKKLQKISESKLNKKVFMSEIKDYSKKAIEDIKKSESKFKHDNLTRNKCPECGHYMLEVNSKRGKMLVCENRECKNRKMISQITNARCPECHKKMELRGEGEKRVFVCSCGYREKLSAFNSRKKEEKNKASKKDINKYLKNQNKKENENFNNPFADALAKLKK
ncbi:DNA topoisomerase III [Peptacetobacter sp.]|uniref:DNA topoisomerase III n=1 Tax=Peptacetobacter sp. TaxID=2991975 RepID=UPI002635A0E1|nr:DNA topoisomerase III [Peptacetobacter sp.]